METSWNNLDRRRYIVPLNSSLPSISTLFDLHRKSSLSSPSSEGEESTPIQLFPSKSLSENVTSKMKTKKKSRSKSNVKSNSNSISNLNSNLNFHSIFNLSTNSNSNSNVNSNSNINSSPKIYSPLPLRPVSILYHDCSIVRSNQILDEFLKSPKERSSFQRLPKLWGKLIYSNQSIHLTKDHNVIGNKGAPDVDVALSFNCPNPHNYILIFLNNLFKPFVLSLTTHVMTVDGVPLRMNELPIPLKSK